MEIILNGEAYNLGAACSVAELVVRLNLDKRKIAVERNLEIVSKSAYDTAEIIAGDKIEIVNFIGGG